MSSSNFRIYVVYIIILLLPLENLIRIGGEGVSISVIDLMVLLVSSIFAAELYNNYWRSDFRVKRVMEISLLISFFVVFNVYYSFFIVNEVLYREAFSVVVMVLLVNYLVLAVRSKRQFDVVKVAIVSGAVMVSMLAWLDSFNIVDLSFANSKWKYAREVFSYSLPFRRTSGIIPNGSVYSSFLMLAFPISFLYSFRSSKRIVRASYFLISTFLFVSFFVTQSRSTVLAVLAMVLVMIIGWGNYSKSVSVRLFYLLIVAPGTLYLVFKIAFMMVDNFDQFIALGTSVTARFEQLEMAYLLFSERPILGYGLGNFTNITGGHLHLHNMYMKILVDLGLIGFIIFLMLFAHVFRLLLYLYRNGYNRERTVAFALFASFSGILVELFFASGLTVINLWLVMALSISIYNVSVISGEIKGISKNTPFPISN